MPQYCRATAGHSGEVNSRQSRAGLIAAGLTRQHRAGSMHTTCENWTQTSRTFLLRANIASGDQSSRSRRSALDKGLGAGFGEEWWFFSFWRHCQPGQAGSGWGAGAFDFSLGQRIKLMVCILCYRFKQGFQVRQNGIYRRNNIGFGFPFVSDRHEYLPTERSKRYSSLLLAPVAGYLPRLTRAVPGSMLPQALVAPEAIIWSEWYRNRAAR